MTWASLNDENVLRSKPFVLAGPILRKVTPTAVTVWLALRVSATVTLTVLDAANKPVMPVGTRSTVAIGSHLHLVAVTAKSGTVGAELTEGKVYRYDLSFAVALPAGIHVPVPLATATDNAVLAYPTIGAPSFCLPPADLNRLRLIQGSCRKSSGDGKDALALVDDLIEETASNPDIRPQQLLLTGDQIYADDVASSMLLMLSDAADALLGWQEVLPVPVAQGGPVIASKLSPYPKPPWFARTSPPGTRQPVLSHANFTSEDIDAHLMSLGEYLCMYLFVWSDVLWPVSPSTLPAMADIKANFKANFHGIDTIDKWENYLDAQTEALESQMRALSSLHASLWKVRRALANIPSYMIFDDHEVTDDWNMTRAIAQGVYSSAFGRRIVQNALVAYTLCQHWGNAPEQFEDSSGETRPQPGRQLLQQLENLTAAKYDQNSNTISSLVGVHDDKEVQKRKAVFHDPNGLAFNFTVEGPGHQIIFTDTRTWRGFPNGVDEAPHLLPRDDPRTNQFTEQIRKTPELKTSAGVDRLLIVVLSTNAPPIEPIRTATANDFLTNHVAHIPDLYESWELPSVPFDRLITALTDKLPIVPQQFQASSEHRGAVIVLSGDVHMSFASRMLYKASKRFEDLPPLRPATAVIAQLVASSLKKQTTDTIGYHREGYHYASPEVAEKLIPEHAPEGYVGWNRPVGEGQLVGFTHPANGPPDNVRLDHAATVSLGAKNTEVEVLQAQDYSYRLDYLVAATEKVLPSTPNAIPPLQPGATSAQRNRAVAAFRQATRAYRTYNTDPSRKPHIVGVNNVGEVTFDWPADDKKTVTHTLRWWNADQVVLTDYVVSLDPDDALFPEIAPVKVSP
jgi:hypothetical protein